MMTPTHLLLNWAVLGDKHETRRERSAILLGALIPDVGVWVFALYFFTFVGAHFGETWEAYYRAPDINVWFNVLHSFILWPLVAFTGYALHKRIIMLGGLSGTLHALCDFFVHADDAYAHFFPFFDWRFYSPISYWDPAHYGNVVGFLDIGIALAALYIVLSRKQSGSMRAFLFCVGIVLVIFLSGRVYFLVFPHLVQLYTVSSVFVYSSIVR